MIKFLKSLVPERHPMRLFYHKIKAVLAAIINGFPANKMIVVGVTGTNGKTTVVNMITSVLTEAGYKTGMTSTVNFQIIDERWTNVSKQTTLGPFQLQKLLKRMVRKGCTHAVIEVTSHAIDQSRVFGINFDIGVITNVTSDHIEYHGDFNSYLNAKGGLFRKVSKGRRKTGIPKVTILNADDKYYGFFNQFVADRKISYGIKNGMIYAADIEKGAKGSRYSMCLPNEKVNVKINIPGEFNVYNSLASASACIALNVPTEKIVKGLENSRGIPGRFEHVDCGQNFDVIVDYAHGPDSLESLLKLYRGLTEGKLFVVFGATGGGRDKMKRPQMGEVAHKHADYVIVTDDDPYEEDEWGIIEQISQGIPRKEGEGFWQIPDRKEAIRFALTMANEGDTVLVAGKGAEEVIMLRGRRLPWNDRKVIEDLLNREIKLQL